MSEHEKEPRRQIINPADMAREAVARAVDNTRLADPETSQETIPLMPRVQVPTRYAESVQNLLPWDQKTERQTRESLPSLEGYGGPNFDPAETQQIPAQRGPLPPLNSRGR